MDLNQLQNRQATVQTDSINLEERLVTLAFSSTTPVARSYGWEVLSHRSDSVDLSRLQQGASVLFNHNWDSVLGVVRSVWVESADGVGRAEVYISKTAEKEWQQIQEGVLRNISIGYTVLDKKEVGRRDGRPVIEATRWRPHEISFVSVPADASVGVGRSLPQEEASEKRVQEPTPPPEVDSEQEPPSGEAPEGDAPEAEEETTVSVSVVVTESPTQEKCQKGHRSMEVTQEAVKARFDEMLDIAKLAGVADAHRLASEAAFSGQELPDFRREMMILKGKTGGSTPLNTSLGMDERELKQYSLSRGLDKMASGERNGFEFDVSQQLERQIGKSAEGLLLPAGVLHREFSVTGEGSTGSVLVPTELSTNYIGMLKNNLVFSQLGATILTGLKGNLEIPKQTGTLDVGFVGESDDAPSSVMTFDKIGLIPKRVAGFTAVTKQMLIQGNSSIDAMILAELAEQIILKIENTAINGSGEGNVPRGLLNTTGVGSVALGANGGALNYGKMVDLRTTVSKFNALRGSLGWLTNGAVEGAMLQTQTFANTGRTLCENGRSATGEKLVVSNMIPSNLTKGEAVALCSALLFGNWRDLLIGFYDVLDITVDPYSSARKGVINVTGQQFLDVAVARPQSFAAIKDILTTV